MTTRYASNRQTLISAFRRVHNRNPTLNEAQIIQSIGEHETNWSTGWGENNNSNNVGAVQGEPGFLHKDHHADGTEYTTYFRQYPTLEDGAVDVVKLVTTRRPTTWEAIKKGDFVGTANAMRQKDPVSGAGGYFEANPTGYANALIKCATKIASDIGEPIASPTSFLSTFMLISGVAVGTVYADKLGYLDGVKKWLGIK